MLGLFVEAKIVKRIMMLDEELLPHMKVNAILEQVERYFEFLACLFEPRNLVICSCKLCLLSTGLP